MHDVYLFSEMTKMKQAQNQQGGVFKALISDIDNTFFRQDKKEVSRRLAEEAMKGNYPIIAVTGADFQTVLKRIILGELPRFQAVVASVGTEIWILNGSVSARFTYLKDRDYDRKLVDESGFDHSKLYELSSKMVSQFNRDCPGRRFCFQDESKQPFKISFYFFSQTQEEIELTRKDVQSLFPSQRIVIAEEINHNSMLSAEDDIKKYCLDILPVTKSEAVNYLIEKVGLQGGIVAGDSGNDSEMLLHIDSKFVSLIVGGAKGELIWSVSNAVGALEPGRHLKDGKSKLFINSRKDLLGPESIEYYARVLLRSISKVQNHRPGI